MRVGFATDQGGYVLKAAILEHIDGSRLVTVEDVKTRFIQLR